MILDEFITGLDIISARDIVNYVFKLREKNKSAMIIVTHQPDEIKDLADKIALIKDGKVQFIKTKEEINKKYKGDFKKFLLEVI